MIHIFLMFIAVFMITTFLGIFGFGIGPEARFCLIKNQLIAERTIGIAMLCCISLWTILVGYGAMIVGDYISNIMSLFV